MGVPGGPNEKIKNNVLAFKTDVERLAQRLPPVAQVTARGLAESFGGLLWDVLRSYRAHSRESEEFEARELKPILEALEKSTTGRPPNITQSVSTTLDLVWYHYQLSLKEMQASLHEQSDYWFRSHQRYWDNRETVDLVYVNTLLTQQRLEELFKHSVIPVQYSESVVKSLGCLVQKILGCHMRQKPPAEALQLQVEASLKLRQQWVEFEHEFAHFREKKVAARDTFSNALKEVQDTIHQIRVSCQELFKNSAKHPPPLLPPLSTPPAGTVSRKRLNDIHEIVSPVRPRPPGRS